MLALSTASVRIVTLHCAEPMPMLAVANDGYALHAGSQESSGKNQLIADECLAACTTISNALQPLVSPYQPYPD